MPYNFLYDPLSLFQFRSNFINVLSLDIKKVNRKVQEEPQAEVAANLVDTRPASIHPQSLIYHLCTALKPILGILCYVTSYATPLSLFQFRSNLST